MRNTVHRIITRGVLLLAVAVGCASASAADRMARFNEAKFGLFVHWGLYSIPAEGEWMMNRKGIPPAVYNRYAEEFNPPASFSPESWVRLAKRAGMRYAVLTTRHHDGFCLWDTKTTDFNSVKTAAKRDFVREFAEACRRNGILVGFYFSLRNWQYDVEKNGKIVPDEWRRQVESTHAALRELMTDYGKVDLLWYDGCSAPGCCDGEAMDRLWQTKKLNAMVRALQPGIVINDRSCQPEDYSTPEQSATAPARGRPWESCMTMNRSWGYNKTDFRWKSADDIWRTLLHCCRFGGNYLLNVGPRADGSVPEESVKTLEEIGRRVQAAARGIYGSVRDDYTEATHAAGVVTKTAAGYTLFAFNDAELDGEASREKIADGVYAVTLKPGAKPCSLLGGRHDIAVKPGDAPVLGDNSAEELPPCGELVTGAALGKLIDGAQAAPSARGVGPQPWFGKAVNVPLPAAGEFVLEVGVIAPRGCPDTVAVRVPEGAGDRFSWTIPAGTRVYAVRLTPDWKVVAPEKWEVAGVVPSPFFEKAPTGANLREAFAPDWAAKARGIAFVPMPERNRLGDHSDRRVNFAYCAPTEGAGMGLARLKLGSADDRTVLACLGVDWWADVYVNGKKVAPLRKLAKEKGDPEFTTHAPAVFRLTLRAGENEILVVNHAGSRSNWLSLWTNLRNLDGTKCRIPERFKGHPMFTTRHCGVNFGFLSRRGYFAQPDVMAQPAKIREAGANWVTLNTHFCQETFASTRVFLDFDWSAGEGELVAVIRELHRQGLHVLLKPCLTNLDSSWMGSVRFPSKVDQQIQGVTNCYWQTWFGSLRNCLRYYGEIAERHGVEGIIIGAEYNGTTDMNDEWERTIEHVRKFYSGPLTYEFMTGEAKSRDFEWLKKLDFLSLSFYPSAAGRDWKERYDRANWPKLAPVSLESMKAMLAERKAEIRELSERFGNMPVLFTEIGTRSCRGNVMLPWDFLTESAWDGEEQANYMEAVFQTFSDLPFWMGLSWWKWDETQKNRAHYSPDPLKDRGFTICGKPAAKVLARWSATK